MNKKAKNILGKLKLNYTVPILFTICYATIEIFCYANLIIGL